MSKLKGELDYLMKALDKVENNDQNSLVNLRNEIITLAFNNNNKIERTKENVPTREAIDKELLKIQSQYPKFSKESKALGKAIRINLPIEERMKSRFISTKIGKNITSATNRILSMMPHRNKKNQGQGR